MGYTSMAILKINLEAQAGHRKQAPSIEPCFDCKGIAVKLGMEV